MGLSKINQEDLVKEKDVLDKLFQCCDKYESCVFNSGAGSGKTYALIECLKHIVAGHREEFNNHNQKIACITYTNVAAEHIREQLGASDIVEISTIHERLWKIIGNQQNALLKLHIENLNDQIAKIEERLESSSDYEKYRKLTQDEQNELFYIMEQNKKIYNRAYNFKAREFKGAMPEEIRTRYKDLLSNAQKFKGLIDMLFRKKRYHECLEKIARGEKKYKEVNYDAMFNTDCLEKMRISHDTLLEYSKKLVEQYPKMRQLIIDYYPFILIDEYQDTANSVVQLMNYLDEYSKEIKHNFFVGYFGDYVQSIYETGVGTKLLNLHPNLNNVPKEYNRRSYSEIIHVANKIRNDEIKQKSIYSDSCGGSVSIYSGKETDIKVFIELCMKKWEADDDNTLHCMFSTNQLVAEYSGFFNVYNAFKETEIYSGVGFKQLNTELLSHDIIHLGKVEAILYKLMKIYVEVRDEKESLRNILPKEAYRNMSYSELKALLKLLKEINSETLDGLLKTIFDEYKNSSNSIYKLIVESIFDIDDLSYDSVVKYFIVSLYKARDESMEATEILKNLLELRTRELLNWFHYVNRDEEKNICYHTIHGTKGLEYENVVIILGKDFGQSKKLFENFFMDYNKDSVTSLEKFERGRNMLYVAVTRAIKNLRILYIDDVSAIEESLKEVFGSVEEFSDKVTYQDI